MSISVSSKPAHAYRPDIDGLRAVAVLAVLFYHAGVPFFGGGYVGVDVFFVISGYLVTGIIAREIDASQFSILRFYERRARRILPALFAMVACVLVAASIVFLPGDFEGVPRSAIAALGFMANVYLFTQAGYFQASADTMPLLHTWSLGVEEQFYIGLPILLIVIARLPPSWRWKTVAAAAAVSFAWALLKQGDSDGFAFYMLPTRAWEMLAGSLLALGTVPHLAARWLREAMCAAGFAGIFAAIFLYDSLTIFPGLAALPPVLGAAALIAYAPGTWAGRLLSMKAPVWIGLMSYSLYLWHWPLIVFTEYTQDAPLSGWQSAGIIALSIAAGWASLNWIERPFRDQRRFDGRRIWRWSAAGIGGLGAAALGLVMMGGWQSRFSAETNLYAAAVHDVSPVRGACLTSVIAPPRPECTLGATVEPTAMIWGDSHAVELGWILGQEYGARGAAIAQRTRGSCAPAVDYDAEYDAQCSEWNKQILQEIAQNPSIKTVYLAAYWDQQHYQAVGKEGGGQESRGQESGLIEPLSRTMTRIQGMGKQVVLIGPVPVQPSQIPRRLALRGRDAPTTTAVEIERSVGWFTRRYPQWRAQNIEIIDVADALMRDGATRVVADGRPFYFDQHHLTVTGARYVLENQSNLRLPAG